MTVEQLWTGGSPTSPTSAEPSSAAHVASSVLPAASEKPTKEKRFLDDIKKLQENLRKTLDTVAIVEEEKMEAVVEAVGSGSAGTEVGVLTAVMLLPVTGWVSDRLVLLLRQREAERRSLSRSRRHRWGRRSGPVRFSVTHQYCANRAEENLESPSPAPRGRCSLCSSGLQVRHIQHTSCTEPRLTPVF